MYILAAAGAAPGLLALLGWAIDVHWMRSIGPTAPQTAPVSAACVVVLAAAVGWWCLRSPAIPRAIAIPAAAVGAVALTALVEITTGADTGLDRILWRGAVESTGVANTGRPSVQAALALAMLAATLLVSVASPSRRGRGAAALLAVAGMSIGGQALVGYALGAEAFYNSSTPGIEGVSVLTALSTVALGAACVLLAIEPSLHQLRSDPGAWRVILRLLPAALAVPLVRAAAIQFTLEQGGRGQIATVLVGAAAVAILVGLVWSAGVALRRIDLQREQLIERLPVAAMVERDGRVVSANDEARQLLSSPAGGAGTESQAEVQTSGAASDAATGIAGDGLLGERTEALLGLSQAVELDLLRERVYAGEAPTAELPCIIGGTDSTVEITGQLIDWENRPASLMVIVDRSEQKRYEATLQAARAEADRANEAKSQFLSKMSHELRTPLNAVLGFAQLLELGDQTERQHDSTRAIIKAGHHLLDLINEILDLSRIEAGSINLSPEPVSLHELVTEGVELLKPLADKRGVTLACNGTTGGCDHFVLADRQRVKQILLNLLSNAIKYNRPHGSVTVFCEQVEGPAIRINVQDTGHGISEADLDRLFQPFQRLGAEATDVEGTGIGLALSKQLAEAMGGRLAVTTTAGRGSTFFCELPEVEGPIERVERLQPLAKNGSSHRPPASELPTILYIEDNLANLKLIQELLDSREHPSNVIAAMQGRLGLELAFEHRPALILLDHHLPDMNGDEVLDRLRHDPRTGSIPVVIISADATPRQVQRLLGVGAAAYLTKPIDVQAFLALVDRLLPSP